MELVRYLEKKGTKDTHGPAHLKLWTDLIDEGKIVEPGEEPNWSNYLDIIRIEPRPSVPQSSLFGARGSSDVLTMLLTSQELRREEDRKKRQEQKTQYETERKEERQKFNNLFGCMMASLLSPRLNASAGLTSPLNQSVSSLYSTPSASISSPDLSPRTFWSNISSSSSSSSDGVSVINHFAVFNPLSAADKKSQQIGGSWNKNHGCLQEELNQRSRGT